MELTFEFDNTRWTPIYYSDNIPYVFFPPEREAGRTGWGALTAGTHHATQYYRGRKITVYSDTPAGDNSGAGAIDATGNTLQITYDPLYDVGAASALVVSTAWSHHPYINSQKGVLTRLMYLPFAPETSHYTVGMGISVTRSYVFDDATKDTGAEARSVVWEQARLGTEEHKDNNKAQAIDWVYKSDNIGINEDVRVRARGLHSRILSHGVADTANRVVTDWTSKYGLFNMAIGSDMKGWTSQITDVAPSVAEAANDGQAVAVTTPQGAATIRTRYKNSAGALVDKTFASSSGPIYGSTTAGHASNSSAYIIDDEEINTISVSDSVKGDSVSYMLFGFLQNKAEKLVIESVKAVLRVLPLGRRRNGR
jgi:hypothetical protein